MIPVALSRWAGGKRWLCQGHPHLLPLPRRRGRAFDVFAGGCSVGFWYLAQGHRVVIGDTNARLIGCLRNLKEKPDSVVAFLLGTAQDYASDADQRGYFYAVREQLNQCRTETTEGAALFLFILRAGFNGLWRENASGECSTTWGDPFAVAHDPRKWPTKSDLVCADELHAISALLQNADIRHGDFEATGHDIARADALFADAPYVPDVKGKAFTGYSKGGFTLNDRLRLAMWLRALDKRGIRWTATDARTDRAFAAYGLWTIDEVSVRRSVAANGAARGDAREVIVRNWGVERMARAAASGVQMVLPERPRKMKQEALFR